MHSVYTEILCVIEITSRPLKHHADDVFEATSVITVNSSLTQCTLSLGKQ